MAATHPPPGARRDDCCARGKWLVGDGRAKYGTLPAFRACTDAHAVFHREAGNVAQAINQKQYARAEAILEPHASYTRASGAVVLAIGTLKREARV